MAERTNIPNSPACGHWETLLADALDGLLRPEEEALFTAHMAVCPACTALFEESQRGRQWLEFLSPEPEVPAGLLDRILAQTGPGQVAGYGLIPASSAMPVAPVWQRQHAGFMGRVTAQARRFAEPRLLMTAAMAFFSIALTLNLTNVRLSSLRLSDLRPAAIRSLVERRVTMASTPIIRYYDHLRFVYEVETRVRELRRTSENDDSKQKLQNSAPGESKQNPAHKDGGSRVDPPQQSASPDSYDFDALEASLTIPALKGHDQSALSGGSVLEVRERSTKWTA